MGQLRIGNWAHEERVMLHQIGLANSPRLLHRKSPFHGCLLHIVQDVGSFSSELRQLECAHVGCANDNRENKAEWLVEIKPCQNNKQSGWQECQSET
jgi:hypothetical protein